MRSLWKYLEGLKGRAVVMVLVAAGNAACQTGGWLLVRDAIDNGIRAGYTRHLTIVVVVYLCVAAVGWVLVNRREVLANAAEHGAVLFRGFPLATAEDFDAFVAAFGLPNFPYYESLSNAVRVNKTPRSRTACSSRGPSCSLWAGRSRPSLRLACRCQSFLWSGAGPGCPACA